MPRAIFFVILLITFRAGLLQSQVVEPVRVELPARIDQPSYYVEALGRAGALVFYESTDTEEGRRKWYFSLLDTNLREKWLQYVLLTDGLMHLASHTDEEKVVLFFGQNEGKRQSQNTFELLRIDLGTGVIVRFTGQLPDRADLGSMAAIGHEVLLGLNLPKYQADLLRFSMSDGSMQSLPLMGGGQAWIQEIKVKPGGSSYFLAIRRFERNRLTEDLFMEIDRQGNELNRWVFKDEDHFLLSVSMLPEEDGLVVCGTFDSDRRRISAREITNINQAGEAKGYYFIRFQQNEPYNASFWLFDNFTNLVRNLPPDMVLRNTRSRSYRYRMAEPDLRITLQFFAGQVQKSGDKYIFSAEAFRPQYRLETRMDYDFYGRLVPYTYSVFEGYQVFAGLAAAFNSSGHLEWSASLELRQVVIPAVRSMVSFTEDNGTLVIASIQQSVLTSKIVDSSGQQLGQTEQTRIEPVFAADRVLEERYSNLSHWYSKYYIATGYQRISNNKLRTNNPRSVFYLQKLILE
ncbi:MAG TPA: hypothetical protein PKE03_00795 [Bacteroidales bacterium]|nr:hypothetical protein [Bacteroidales bacterium]